MGKDRSTWGASDQKIGMIFSQTSELFQRPNSTDLSTTQAETLKRQSLSSQIGNFTEKKTQACVQCKGARAHSPRHGPECSLRAGRETLAQVGKTNNNNKNKTKQKLTAFLSVPEKFQIPS